MKTITALSVLALTLLATSVPTHAADTHGNSMAIGVGGELCQDNLTMGRLNGAIITWAGGFLTAYSHLTPDTYDITNMNTSWPAWLTEYCQLNPREAITTALLAYITAAYPIRLVQQPPKRLPAAPQSQGQPPAAYPSRDELVATVRARLNAAYPTHVAPQPCAGKTRNRH
jgi:hypothetical protein